MMYRAEGQDKCSINILESKVIPRNSSVKDQGDLDQAGPLSCLGPRHLLPDTI